MTGLLYEFGPFTLDAAEQLLLRDGQPVALKPKIFDLLLVLVQNSGHVVHKNELMSRVWPDTVVEENNLTVSIFVLRKALGETHNGHRYIETVPKRGYRFAADVTVEATGSGSSTQIGINSLTVTNDARSLITNVQSLAVLPFTILGAEAQDDYLGLGLADALITKLSNIKQVAVRPTSAVRNCVEKDPVSAGRWLRVSAVLEGAIQLRNEEIRVTVQLVSVRDGRTVWAEKFNEKFTNIFAIEDLISEEVARALELRLTAEELAQLSWHYTENTQAYQAYLKGRYFLERMTPEGIEKGIESFELAIRTDSNYALAYAGLADCHTYLGACEFIPPKDAGPKAEAAARKAIEIDNNLAEAHAAVGYCKMFDWDWSSAERELKLAIELNPTSAIVHQRYAVYLRFVQRFEEALAEGRRAVELDPTSHARNASVGGTLYFAGHYDQAIEQLRRALELESNNGFARVLLGRAYAQKGMFEQAKTEYEKLVSITGKVPESLAHRGHLCAKSGKNKVALELLNELEELYKSEYVPHYYKAFFYTALGRHAEAFESLERAYQGHEISLCILGIDPMLDDLRDDPRFLDLLQRIGLTSADPKDLNKPPGRGLHEGFRC